MAATACLLLAPALIADKAPEAQAQWSQWRGPLGTGVAPLADPPLVWSEKQNLRWKTPIPGRGHSTPVIWDQRIFLTTAIPRGEPVQRGESGPRHAPGAHDNYFSSRRLDFVVLAVDRKDGTILWQRTVHDELPHEGTHETGSWASPSAATDGEHVIASFGSAGLFGLTVDGELVWRADLGDMHPKHGHGEGSSPALYGNTVIVNWDHEGDSFVVALDKRTGKQRWKRSRDEGTSWSTPLVVEHEGKPQVVISATNRVRAYDLSDGKVVWECGGLSGNVVASPVAAAGYVYVANSYETRSMMAIRLSGASGDITGSDAVVWRRDRDTPYVPSPVLYDDSLCFLKHYQGLLTCVEARSGKTLFGPQRLEGVRNVYASLVGAAGRIYITDLDGATAVVEHGADFRQLALNRLDDSFAASPAIAGDTIYLRGLHHLYAIGESKPGP